MAKTLVVFLLFLAAFNSAFSQTVDSLLEIQRAADPREKVYVQFDKAYYNPGETIWFKAYLFADATPSQVSKNFYAEFLDEKGNVLNQVTAPIAFSGASGSYAIDSNFAKQALYFRAFTASMLNDDTCFLFTKAIRILSPKAAATKTTTLPQPPTLRFLPEGGEWTAGLPSTIAFIATNQQGLPVDISGIITDNIGAKLTDFRTLHNGMGSVIFTPEEGRTYTASWKAGNKQYTTPLPPVRIQGIGLRVAEAENGRRFTLYRATQTDEALMELRVIACMNQHLAFQAYINMRGKTVATGLFPTKDLPSGILQITVLDKNNKPVAERVCFVNNHEYEFDSDAFLSQRNLTRRGLNSVEITVSDTVPANLSLAITDANLNQTNTMDDNIVSRLLLTSDLRGKIVNPYYYFYSNDDSVSAYLDLVMLTHGWRRYNWQDVFAGKAPSPRWKESNYLNLSGTIAGLPPGGYSPDLQLVGILQTPDSAKTVLTLPVDRKGTVFTDGLVFYGNAKLFFNFNKKSLSFDKSMLMVDNGLRKGYRKAVLDSATKTDLADVGADVVANNQNITKLAQEANRQAAKKGTLQTVTVTAKAKTPKEKLEDKYVSGLFAGDAYSFDLVNDPLSRGYTDIFQYLQGKVAGLQISTNFDGVSLQWRGSTPALYLNEMQVNADMIRSTSVSDIAYIKVFRPGESVMRRGGDGGVIAIYTRRGGDALPDPNAKSMNAVQLTGYTPIKEFYSPDYATPSERDALDDVRSTLYWNPAIYLDKTRRRVRLHFYNNDVTKRFRLIMEGINADGKLVHIEKEVGN